jgi:hypothetical protein
MKKAREREGVRGSMGRKEDERERGEKKREGKSRTEGG